MRKEQIRNLNRLLLKYTSGSSYDHGWYLCSSTIFQTLAGHRDAWLGVRLCVNSQ